jgi:putative phosphoribosyl transferase
MSFSCARWGVPGHEELAIGAIASGGIEILNHDSIEQLQIPRTAIVKVIARERAELKRREQEYRDDRPDLKVRDQIVILVDDGLATGSTMRAAATSLRQKHPKRVVVAVPVAAASTCEEFREEVEETVCATTPHPFLSVGMWYEDFSQTTDWQVKILLEMASQEVHFSSA